MTCLHPQDELVDDYSTGDSICRLCGLVVQAGLPFAEPRPRYNADGFLFESRVDGRLRDIRENLKDLAERIFTTQSVVNLGEYLASKFLERSEIRVNSERLSAACMYIACMKESVPRTLLEIAHFSGLRTSSLKLMVDQVSSVIEGYPRARPHYYIDRFCRCLDVPTDVHSMAYKIAVDVGDSLEHSPQNVAAAIIKFAANEIAYKLDDRFINEITGVSITTLKTINTKLCKLDFSKYYPY